MKNWVKNSLLLALAFLVARVYLSYMWLTNAESKVMYDFNLGLLLKSQVDGGSLPTWWESFMRALVLPNLSLFEILVTVGELCVGVALLLGIFTRFSALTGAFMNLSFFLTFQATLDLRMLVLQLVLVIFATSAGKIGLDPYLKPWMQKVTKLNFRTNGRDMA